MPEESSHFNVENYLLSQNSIPRRYSLSNNALISAVVGFTAGTLNSAASVSIMASTFANLAMTVHVGTLGKAYE